MTTPGIVMVSGELWFYGWDIPLKWAIDDNGLVWVNRAHGGDPSIRISRKDLLEMTPYVNGKAELKKAFRQNPARRAGVRAKVS